MRRRGVLIGGGALAVAAAIGGVVAIPGEIGLVQQILRRNLPDLRMSETEQRLFADEFLASYRRNGEGGGDTSILVARVLDPLPDLVRDHVLPKTLVWSRNGFENQVMRMFLLSTDYLEARQQPGRETLFMVIADPYIAGCANPLARFEIA